MKLMGKQWELACLAALLLVAGDAIGASSRAGAMGLVANGPVAASSPCLSRRGGGDGQLLRLRGGAFWFSATAGEEEFVSAPPYPAYSSAYSSPRAFPTT